MNKEVPFWQSQGYELHSTPSYSGLKIFFPKCLGPEVCYVLNFVWKLEYVHKQEQSSDLEALQMWVRNSSSNIPIPILSLI